jgi:Tyrosine phosphatase family
MQRLKLPAFLLTLICLGAPAHASTPSTQPIGEKIPSEDADVADFHSLGLIEGHLDIFRSACPVRDIAKHMSTTQPSNEQFHQAQARLRHLYDLGIRTIISFQDPKAKKEEDKGIGNAAVVALERSAAESVGIHFISQPMNNSGRNSLETMTDQQVQDWLDQTSDQIFASAKTGGVLFHCSAGHDRTGIVSAYLRIKFEHWPVDQAIDEMRRLGHNWPKFSHNNGLSSWHEDHLRAIAASSNDHSATASN